MKLSNKYRLLTVLATLMILFSCAEMKQTGQKIGHTTRDITREIGHTTRDITRDIGHGTRDIVKAVGDKAKQLVSEDDAENDEN